MMLNKDAPDALLLDDPLLQGKDVAGRMYFPRVSTKRSPGAILSWAIPAANRVSVIIHPFRRSKTFRFYRFLSFCFFHLDGCSTPTTDPRESTVRRPKHDRTYHDHHNPRTEKTLKTPLDRTWHRQRKGRRDRDRENVSVTCFFRSTPPKQ